MYQATRLFVSSLNARLAQRFLALVLLPHVRQDIRENRRLHFALFQAMKKAAYKPDAFYKARRRTGVRASGGATRMRPARPAHVCLAGGPGCVRGCYVPRLPLGSRGALRPGALRRRACPTPAAAPGAGRGCCCRCARPGRARCARRSSCRPCCAACRCRCCTRRPRCCGWRRCRTAGPPPSSSACCWTRSTRCRTASWMRWWTTLCASGARSARCPWCGTRRCSASCSGARRPEAPCARGRGRCRPHREIGLRLWLRRQRALLHAS